MKEKTYCLLLKPRSLVRNYFFLDCFMHIGYVYWKASIVWNPLF